LQIYFAISQKKCFFVPDMQNDRPILTITGSDPAGSSGVQADIKTISSLGGYAVSAITSITIQNTLGILEFHDLPASVVAGQIEAIVNDVEPQTVKIGMIRTLDTLEVVVAMLQKYHPRHVVYMPVTLSAQGDRLMSAQLTEAIRLQLLPLCTIVIPNTQFTTHGEANAFASAVAYFLNEGMETQEALSLARQKLDAEYPRPLLRSRSQELYEQFVKTVDQYFRTNSEVRFYADQLNVASGYLAQVTRRIRSMSPKAIIDERIIIEAERMLHTTDYTIQEIAYTLGFNNQAHFSKYFKKLKGISPKQFRQNERTSTT
jgi:hydroxymethylpyrimidine/phosphomethylpyrimidine kinase